MTATSGQWDDLSVRVTSGIAMAVVGLGAVWLGGYWFLALVLALAGIIVWELASMLSPDATKRDMAQLVILSVLGLGLAVSLPPLFSLPVLFAAVIASLSVVKENKGLFGVFNALVLVAALGLFVQLDQFGLTWMLWLALVVIVTDIFGYFAGRVLGGPKFWPAISPKKTWSGTVAGWLGAAILGVVFMIVTPAGSEVIGYSVLLSFASQLGDIAESWVKRRTGNKDSSHLIPGHGGVWDRFDGMLGAALVLLCLEQVTNFPPVMIVAG